MLQQQRSNRHTQLFAVCQQSLSCFCPTLKHWSFSETRLKRSVKRSELVLFSFEQTAHVRIIIGYSRRRYAIATSLDVLERVDRGFFGFAIPEALHALSSELFLMTSV